MYSKWLFTAAVVRGGGNFNCHWLVYDSYYQVSGLVIRVSVMKLGGQDSRSSYIKGAKSGWHSASRDGLGVSPCNILVSCPGGVLVHQAAS